MKRETADSWAVVRARPRDRPVVLDPGPRSLSPSFPPRRRLWKKPEEDSQLGQSLFATQIDYFLLDMLPTPRQQCRENDESDRSDEEYFREITRIVAEGSEADQPHPQSAPLRDRNYRQISAHPSVVKSNSQPASRDNHR